MVTKNKTGGKKGRVKVGKLQLEKETVKNLTSGEARKIKGGTFKPRVGNTDPGYETLGCNTQACNTGGVGDPRVR